ncbi:MAG: thioesterase family protein [Hyphomicrobiales bacterium]|nr:MAG: thioesterase family protein [Hyphomicrobiales bacterium]
MAVAGALARGVEREVADRPGMRAVKWNVDLFRPALARPSTVRTRVVRAGRRVCLVDAEFTQEDRAVSRATALFLASGTATAGSVWEPRRENLPPPHDMRPTTSEPRIYYSEAVGWTSAPECHQNSSWKQTWHFATAIVADEDPTAFQFAASVADVGSVVTNWGSAGLEFINVDVSMVLGRVPDGVELGLAALDRVEHEGVAVGTAHLFDRRGPLGVVTTSALENSDHAIDLRRLGAD